MKCEVQVCTVKANGYESCEIEATFISFFGHCYCAAHSSPRDLSLSSPKSWIEDRLEKREAVKEAMEQTGEWVAVNAETL